MHVRHVYIKTTGAVSIKAVRTACIYYTHTHTCIYYTHTHTYTLLYRVLPVTALPQWRHGTTIIVSLVHATFPISVAKNREFRQSTSGTTAAVIFRIIYFYILSIPLPAQICVRFALCAICKSLDFYYINNILRNRVHYIMCTGQNNSRMKSVISIIQPSPRPYVSFFPMKDSHF